MYALRGQQLMVRISAGQADVTSPSLLGMYHVCGQTVIFSSPVDPMHSMGF